MTEKKLGPIEARFASLIWDNAPLTSTALARLAEGELGWKKSTAYTVLKRLCDGGLFQNDGGLVTPRLSREEYLAKQSEQFVEETFDGSLPAFLAAFGSRKQLSGQEIAQLQAVIDDMRRQSHD